MRVGIFTADSNGGYPVPASKGGAVSTLIEHIVEGNSEQHLMELSVFSFYDSEAEQISQKYKNVEFIWVKPPVWISYLDRLFFYCIKTFFKRRKAVSYRTVFSLIYYICVASMTLRKRTFDKVILENNVPLAWCIRLSRYRGEYYYHFHNVPRINGKCKKVFAKCTSVICVSGYVADEIATEQNPIGPIARERLAVLYNCVDTDQFQPLQDVAERERLRKAYGFQEEDKVLCFVGRLTAEKGADKVLEAVHKLHRDDIKILIVGSFMHGFEMLDDYQKKLYALSAALGDRVIFTGYIPQSEVQKIYQISDLAVLPSMWEEPAGLTNLEAMACGIPLITTNAGGIREYVGDTIVLERDEKLTENLAAAIVDVLDDAHKYAMLSEYGVQRVSSEFDKMDYARRLMDCLEA